MLIKAKQKYKIRVQKIPTNNQKGTNFFMFDENSDIIF